MKARLPKEAIRQVRRADLTHTLKKQLYRLLEDVAAVVASVELLVALARVAVGVITGRIDPGFLELLIADES